MVGDQFCIWLKNGGPAPTDPTKMLDDTSVAAALAVLEEEFRELVEIRDRYSANTRIFVNCYDFPQVTGIPVCGQGPWLKPSIDWAYGQLGVTSPLPDDEFTIVKTLLKRFKQMLDKVASDSKVKNFAVVPTQDTLYPAPDDWQNEIHPSTQGFIKIAKKFQAALTEEFP